MKIIGHRGASGLAPENTLAAIEQALLYRVNEIEIDVRITSDGHVILSHDAKLKRTVGKALVINESTLSLLADAKPDICTLEAALSLINRRVPLLIEVKPDVTVKPIVEVIKKYRELGWQAADFRLASFRQKILLELHAAIPDISLVVNSHFSAVHSTRRARQLDAKRINIDGRIVWFGLVRSLARGGYQLTVHNMNSPRALRKVKRWGHDGLYGIVTDYPDRTSQLRDR